MALPPHPSSVDDLQEYRIKLLEERIGDLSNHVQKLEIKAEQRERERAEEQRKSLWAGISFLGSIVLALGGVIWAYRAVIFQGRAP